MYKPKFQYTNKIVKNLTAIAESRAIILNSPLIPKWEISLRRDALLRNAHSSTAIEGNPLTLEEVSELAAGREIMVSKKDRQEVLNYIEALENIPKFSKITPFTPKDLLKVHKIVTKDTLQNPGDEGNFRNILVYIGNRREVIYMPPPPDTVPGLVEQFLEWFNSVEKDEIEPVIEAGITHYEIVRIHPFVDGNGRTTRVMATLILYRRGFDIKRFFALDDYYDQDRSRYYAALKSVDQNTQDQTQWLEYFTEGVAVSIKAVERKVIGLSKNIKVLKEKGQIQLTERQMKIIEQIMERGSITNREIREMFKVSNRAALDEISKLIDLKVVVRKGEGRSVKYQLV
ncbi:MAG: Fic family protein [Actinobacteria bacterium]|nr:Fic family protein [Actinomycetota bacterium]